MNFQTKTSWILFEFNISAFFLCWIWYLALPVPNSNPFALCPYQEHITCPYFYEVFSYWTQSKFEQRFFLHCKQRKIIRLWQVVTWCLRTYIGLRPYMVNVYIKERINDQITICAGGVTSNTTYLGYDTYELFRALKLFQSFLGLPKIL